MLFWQRALKVLLLSITIGVSSRSAIGHEHEFGISIQPEFLALPAISDTAQDHTISLGVGGGLGFEYYVAQYLALVLSNSYAHSVVQSKISPTVKFDRLGDYTFNQDGFLSLLGLRLESPSWWLPVSFFLKLAGGFAVLIQTNGQLLDANNQAYDFTFPTSVNVKPVISIGNGFFVRVADQIRFNTEFSVELLPIQPVLVGFGVSLGITFLFFGGH